MNARVTFFEMNQELKIVAIGVNDIELIIQLANEIWPATYKHILSGEQVNYMMDLFYSTRSLEEQMKEKQHQFIIAKLENKPVAFASYGPTNEAGVYKLHKVYVHPNLQGKGVGKCILQYILKEVGAVNAHALELNVNRNNPAKNFYEKFGFVVSHKEDIDIGAGYYMNDYVMRIST